MKAVASTIALPELIERYSLKIKIADTLNYCPLTPDHHSFNSHIKGQNRHRYGVKIKVQDKRERELATRASRSKIISHP